MTKGVPFESLCMEVCRAGSSSTRLFFILSDRPGRIMNVITVQTASLTFVIHLSNCQFCSCRVSVFGREEIQEGGLCRCNFGLVFTESPAQRVCAGKRVDDHHTWMRMCCVFQGCKSFPWHTVVPKHPSNCPLAASLTHTHRDTRSAGHLFLFPSHYLEWNFLGLEKLVQWIHWFLCIEAIKNEHNRVMF